MLEAKHGGGFRELIELGIVAGLTELEAATARAHVGEVAEILCQSRDDRGRFHKPRLFRWRADKAPGDCIFDLNPGKHIKGQRSAAPELRVGSPVRPIAGPA